MPKGTALKRTARLGPSNAKASPGELGNDPRRYVEGDRKRDRHAEERSGRGARIPQCVCDMDWCLALRRQPGACVETVCFPRGTSAAAAERTESWLDALKIVGSKVRAILPPCVAAFDADSGASSTA